MPPWNVLGPVNVPDSMMTTVPAAMVRSAGIEAAVIVTSGSTQSVS
jgi:hypothetical protein